MLLPLNTRLHVLTALDASPWVVRRLAETVPAEDPRWQRADAGRFACREVIAHLADWEVVFAERLRRTVAGDTQPIEDADAEQRAESEGYSVVPVLEGAELFMSRRRSLVEYLVALPDDAWGRAAVHPRHGPMTVEAQAVHVLGHDGYHLGYLARLLSGA